MNWDAISAIAEILGAVAVVASLVYVGKQVAQNTAMMRVGAASETLEKDFELTNPILESAELAAIWSRGDHRLDELGEADRQRLIFFERRAIMLWHHNFELRNQGLFPDANWHNQNWIIQNIGQRQSCREAWSLFRDSFEGSFQKYIEEHFRSADDATE